MAKGELQLKDLGLGQLMDPPPKKVKPARAKGRRHHKVASVPKNRGSADA